MADVLPDASANQAVSDTFDLPGTLTRLGGDVELLRDLIDMFAEDAPVMIAQMSEAAAAGYCEDVQHFAHSLRGLAANFGAVRVTGLLAQLEEKAATKSLDGGREILAAVRPETERLLAALASYR